MQVDFYEAIIGGNVARRTSCTCRCQQRVEWSEIWQTSQEKLGSLAGPKSKEWFSEGTVQLLYERRKYTVSVALLFLLPAPRRYCDDT